MFLWHLTKLSLKYSVEFLFSYQFDVKTSFMFRARPSGYFPRLFSLSTRPEIPSSLRQIPGREFSKCPFWSKTYVQIILSSPRIVINYLMSSSQIHRPALRAALKEDIKDHSGGCFQGTQLICVARHQRNKIKSLSWPLSERAELASSLTETETWKRSSWELIETDRTCYQFSSMQISKSKSFFPLILALLGAVSGFRRGSSSYGIRPISLYGYNNPRAQR